MNLPDRVAEPRVEGIWRAGEALEHRGQVVGVDVYDGEVPGRAPLQPRRFAVDAETLSRGDIVRIAGLATSHGSPPSFELPGQDRRREGNVGHFFFSLLGVPSPC